MQLLTLVLDTNKFHSQLSTMQKESCFEDEIEAEIIDQILNQTQDNHNIAEQKPGKNIVQSIVQDMRENTAESGQIAHDGHNDEQIDNDDKISEDETNDHVEIDLAVPLDASEANK